MAYTSIIPVSRLDNSITYIRNKDKTTKKGQSAGSLEEAMVDPRRNIISQAMEAEMNLLRQQLQKLKSENENLIKENQKLKKALSKKELNLIKQI